MPCTPHIALLVDSRIEALYILNRMATVQAYSVQGKRYWRIVESYRDARGRPKLRVVRHLGNAQTLLKLLSQAPGRPLYARRTRVWRRRRTVGYRPESASGRN